ncbi:MAG: DUF4271 domain-containing protein [Bacteroidales bacterium]
MLIVILVVFMSTQTRSGETFQNLFRQLVYRHAFFSLRGADLNASNHRKFILNVLTPCIMFLIIYQGSKLYFPEVFTIIEANLLMLLCLIVVVFVFRYVIYSVLGVISDNRELTKQFIELNFTAGQLFSMISIPLLVFLFYAPPILKLISFAILVLAMLAIILVLMYRGLLIFVLNKYSIFYFILYLCAVEILPAAFFAKWLLF